jgi:hypothetical protein
MITANEDVMSTILTGGISEQSERILKEFLSAKQLRVSKLDGNSKKKEMGKAILSYESNTYTLIAKASQEPNRLDNLTFTLFDIYTSDRNGIIVIARKNGENPALVLIQPS